MSLLALAGTNSATGGYDIANSLKFESDNSERISFTPSSAVASERRKHTISFWIKRTELGSTQYIYEWGGSEGDYLRNFLRFQSDDTLRFATSYNVIINTTRVFRDTSAWYHIVIQTDTVQSSNSDTKFWMYVNGELEGSSTAFNASDTMAFANNSQHDIGFTSVDNGAYGNYYLAEFNAVGGLKLAPTEFGEFDEDTGIWKPKAYTGSYGTNGFYLDFESSGSLGADGSGNGNNFTLNNITSADQALDTPTNNFATMTEAWAYASQLEVRWGGTLTTTNTAAWSGAKSTIGVNKGKWYWEIRWNDTISTYTGIQTQGEDNISASGSAAHARNTSLSIGAGSKYRTYINGTDTLFSSQPSGNISTGEVTGFALDLDSGTKTLKLIRSDSVVQTYTLTDSLATEYVFPFCSTYAQTLVWNLGGFFHYSLSSAQTDANGLGSFEFSPTIGGVNYYALCTKNLEEFG